MTKKKDHQIGDAPVQPELRERMNLTAKAIDDIFNGEIRPKKIGFCLMLFPFDDFDGRCNYISNADPKDVLVLLKEQVARMEGRLMEAKGKQ